MTQALDLAQKRGRSLTFDELGVIAQAKCDGGALKFNPGLEWRRNSSACDSLQADGRSAIIRRRPSGERLLILIGHGDGMHMKLAERVLCGVAPQFSSSISGDCSFAGGTCRKTFDSSKVIYASSLSYDEVALLSCNSVNVERQLHRSSVSLVSAFLGNGKVKSVLGTWRSTAVSPEIVEDIGNRWSLGEALVEIARSLSPIQPSVENEYVVVSNGLGVSAAPSSDAPRTTHHIEPTLNTVHLEAVDRGTERAVERLRRRLMTSSELRLRAAVLGSRTTNDTARKALRDFQLSASNFETVSHLALDRLIEGKTRRSESVTPYLRLANQWHSAWLGVVQTALLQSSEPDTYGDDLDTILSRRTRPGRAWSGAHCDNCGSAVRHFDLADSSNRSSRITSGCAGCGPLENSTADTNHRPRVSFSLPSTRGERVSLLISLASDPGRSLVAPRGLVQFRHKTLGSASILTDLVFENGSASCSFSLDPESPPDIYSVRVVAISDFHTSYLRRLGRLDR